MIVAGTLGHNAFIDQLVHERKLDVSRVAGRWETFLIQIVERPTADVDHALIIAGSDKRGTIFGLYDVSASIGVSPWTWWADVPVRRQPDLYVLPGAHSDGEPAVKYRGIFLNDEAPALTGWAKEKFGGINHKFYEKVFELILRLKGNYLWPAMWGNAFNDDDKVDPQLADDYGIVMGTSHHEPMLRAQQEWKRYGKGEWNYEHNDSTLRAFWADGIRNMGSHESIVTVGMRGDGDMPMTAGSNIALLERIVRDQRDDHRVGHEEARVRDAAGLGALQGSAGLLRQGHARARRRHAALFRRQLGKHPAPAVARRHRSRRRLRDLLPLRLRRRPAQLQVDQHESDRARLGADAPRVRVRRAPHLDRERRRPEADGIPDLVLPRLRVEPEPHSRGEPSGVHAPLGRAAVRLGAIDGDR